MTTKVILHTHSGKALMVETEHPNWMNNLQIGIAAKKSFNQNGMKDRVLWAEVAK